MISVDVIVPCYRYGHFLRECVQSVLSQTGVKVRVLIIDDASPDNTADVAADLVRMDPRVTFVRHIQNRGHIATYNEGIEWASADYMLLLSADDYLLPGALERAASLMDEHPEVVFTFGKSIELWEGQPAPQKDHFANGCDRGKPAWRILRGCDFIELSGASNIVTTPTAVVRTGLQKRLGGYRQELPHTGDMEMWLRFAAHGSIGILETHQAVYRRHGANMSDGYACQGWLPDLRQRKAALDCFFETCSDAVPNSSGLHRSLSWSLARCAVGFASMAFNEGQMALSAGLSEFALSVCPSFKRSLPWLNLTCKRGLGLAAWRFLSPFAERVRRRIEG